jgi:hypothetical protein
MHERTDWTCDREIVPSALRDAHRKEDYDVNVSEAGRILHISLDPDRGWVLTFQ